MFSWLLQFIVVSGAFSFDLNLSVPITIGSIPPTRAFETLGSQVPYYPPPENPYYNQAPSAPLPPPQYGAAATAPSLPQYNTPFMQNYPGLRKYARVTGLFLTLQLWQR